MVYNSHLCWNPLTRDAGLHLNPKGYHLLYDKIYECIANNWPDQLPDNLPYALPRWDDGDAWRLRGETGSVTNNRPRPAITPIPGATCNINGQR